MTPEIGRTGVFGVCLCVCVCDHVCPSPGFSWPKIRFCEGKGRRRVSVSRERREPVPAGKQERGTHPTAVQHHIHTYISHSFASGGQEQWPLKSPPSAFVRPLCRWHSTFKPAGRKERVLYTSKYKRNFVFLHYKPRMGPNQTRARLFTAVLIRRPSAHTAIRGATCFYAI